MYSCVFFVIPSFTVNTKEFFRLTNRYRIKGTLPLLKMQKLYKSYRYLKAPWMFIMFSGFFGFPAQSRRTDL